MALLASAFFYVKNLGYEDRNQEVQAQLAQQIVRGATDMYKLQENTARIVNEHIIEVAQLREASQAGTREVIRYVNSKAKKCVVSPELHQSFDAVTKLYDTPDTTNRLPATPEATGRVDAQENASVLQPGGVPGDDAPRPMMDPVLLFAYNEVASRLASCIAEGNNLIDWVQSTYEQQLKAAGYE